jgi:hypothetical protein
VSPLRWLLLLAFAGCATESAYFTPINTPPHHLTPRSPLLVDVYTYTRVARPTVEVGVIEIRPPGDPGQVINRLRAEAAHIGCDGLLILPGELRIKYGSSIQEPSNRGVCVVYTDDSDDDDERPRAAPAKAAPPPKPPATEPPTSI